jgi:putative Mn2+ efflux pump MntP
MIIDAVKGGDEKLSDKLNIKELLVLSVATSIDALAVGFTFAITDGISIFISAAVIGVITFAVCFGGVFLGSLFGNKFGKPASVAGGCVLILIGSKIMLEGIGII